MFVRLRFFLFLAVAFLSTLSVGCTCERAWSPATGDSDCALEQRQELRSQEAWQETFGSAQSSALACLQLAWVPGEAKTTLVRLQRDGTLRAQDDQQEVSPNILLPPSARGQKRRFRLFVFQPNTANPGSLCSDTMAAPTYNCLNNPATCWFTIEFRPEPRQQTLPITSPAGNDPQPAHVTCRLYTHPQDPNDGPDERETTAPDVATPEEGRPEPPQEPTTAEPPPSDAGTPELPETSDPGGCRPGTTRACYTGSDDTRGMGACKDGTQTCQSDGSWRSCEGEVTPKAEQCDGLDNNCDGTIDENCGGCIPQTFDRIVAKAHPEPIVGLAFRDDNTLLTASQHRFSSKRQLHSWDLTTKTPTPILHAPLNGENELLSAFALSPSGKILLYGSSFGTVNTWDLDSNTRLSTFKHAQQLGISKVAYSASGKFAYASRTSLYLDSTSSTVKRCPATGTGHNRNITALAFSPTQPLLFSGQDDGDIFVWSYATGTCERKSTLTPTNGGHREKIHALAFSPDGKVLLSASEDKRVLIWKITSNLPTFSLPPTVLSPNATTTHLLAVHDVAFDPTGKYIATASKDKTVKIWDFATKQTLFTATLDAVPTHIAWSPNGKLVAIGKDNGDISLMSAITGNLTYPIDTHMRGPKLKVNDFTIDTSTNRLYTLSNQKELWNSDLQTFATGSNVSRRPEHFTRVALDPKGRWLATNQDKDILLLDLKSLNVAYTLPKHSSTITALAFSPDGQWLASGSTDRSIVVWDLSQTPRFRRQINIHNGTIHTLAFHPNSKELASGSQDQRTILWDFLTSSKNFEFPVSSVPIFTLAYSPDGKQLAVGSQNATIQLWDLTALTPSLKPATILKAHALGITALAYHPDGAVLTSASSDDTIIHWDLKTQQPLHTLRMILQPATKLFFLPQRKELAAASGASIYFWRCP